MINKKPLKFDFFQVQPLTSSDTVIKAAMLG